MVYWESARLAARLAMGVAIIVAAGALIVGWHFSQARMAHGAIPGRKAQLGPLRRDRARHLLWAIGLAVLIAVIFVAIAR
jgi:hypothetical protein